MASIPVVYCEGHDNESFEDNSSSGEDQLRREKRDVEETDEDTAEDDEKETSSIRSYSSSHHHRRTYRNERHHDSNHKKRRHRMKEDRVFMPDRTTHSITVPYISKWKCGTPATLIPLSPTGKMAKKEYDLVLKQFTDAVQTPMNYQVQKIEKIVNGCTWKRYKRSCEKILSEAGHVNERMLFHGTGSFQTIMDNGFDERYARNGLYGFGVYFSPLSSKSNGYTPVVNGDKHMLLCRVALGRVFRAPSYFNYPHPPAGHNAVEGTVIAATNDCVEIIVYRGEQAYPEYLITYK